MSLTRTSVVAALLLNAACAASTLPDSFDDELPSTGRVEVTTVASFDPGSTDSPRSRLAVRSAALWDSVAPSLYRDAPASSVFDFNRETVVVARMGSQSSSGYSIAVTGAAVAGGELVVEVQETVPGRGCGNLTVITSPVVVARVARAGLPVRFVERRTERTCG